jgi:hypothetical protein
MKVVCKCVCVNKVFHSNYERVSCGGKKIVLYENKVSENTCPLQ